jgi:nitrate/nitrite-specific signal transduction histidine kinase
MTLRSKIFLPLALLSALFFGFLFGYWFPQSLRNLEREELHATERHLNSVAEGLVPLLLAHQLDAVYENLDALMSQNKEWIGLRLLNPDGTLLYPIQEASAGTVAPGQQVRVVEHTIQFLGSNLGKVILTIDIASITAPAEKRHRQLVTALLAVFCGYLVSLGAIVERIVSRPVNHLAHAAEKIAQGDFDAPLSKTGHDEVGRLVDSFAGMRDAIRNYQESLHIQTIELEEEVAERQMTQESLQEKALLLEEEIEKRQKVQDELEQLNERLEQRVEERTAELHDKNDELERLNRIFVGRELRMIELKERIKQLEGQNAVTRGGVS